MIVDHGLTPICHGEIGVECLGPLKLCLGEGVLEKVQQQHPLLERGLCFWRLSRRREIQFSKHSAEFYRVFISRVRAVMGEGERAGEQR
jgi:hypothetical protein